VLEGLSTSEVYEQLKLALSPANQRASCRSVIYPGGKCSCVDATPFDEDNCFMVPVFDGKKTVCLDALPPGRPCLVYSFGIRDDISFETEMVKFGCEVHAFDPTVRLNTTGLPAGLHVHYLGVDGRSWTYQQPDGRQFELVTLDALVERLGHRGRRVDYLKLDAEGSEWATLRQQLRGSGQLLRRLPQFTVELHLLFPRGMLSEAAKKETQLSVEDAAGFLQTLRDVEAAGFQLLEVKADTSRFKGTGLAMIYETTWLRVTDRREGSSVYGRWSR